MNNSVYLDYWNSLPNITRHINTDTKTYKAAHGCCISLLRGRFFRNKSFSCDFARKINIKKYNRAWTRKEIFEGLGLLSEAFSSDSNRYKYIKNRSLVCLFYNHIRKESMLLEVVYIACNASISNKIMGNSDNSSDQLIIKELFSAVPVLSQNITEYNQEKLINGIKSIVYFHKHHIQTHNSYSIRKVGLLNFGLMYYNFLKELDWLEIIYVGAVTTNSKLWKRFIVFLESEYDCKIFIDNKA